MISKNLILYFLFGGSTIEIAKKGLELMKDNYAPHIITTGNTGTFGNPDWDKPSANIFADYLIENGIDSDKILIQNQSTNTPEDITFSLPILESNNIKLKSIILVSRPVHQRRAYATFKKQFPYKVKIVNTPCDELHPSNLKDKQLEEVGIRCLQEYERLIKYAEKGDVEGQLIPEEVAKAADKLLKILPK